MPIRFLTAGESHGPSLTVIVEGMPAGLVVRPERMAVDMQRRMGGYGRGGRMKIETDAVEITAGVRFGRSLGSPICLVIANRDFANWSEAMSPLGDPPDDRTARVVTRPRPGHADLAGALKHRTHDARDVFERSSARETAARTAAGAVARSLLSEVGIAVTSRTGAVGTVTAPAEEAQQFDALQALPVDAPFRSLDPAVIEAMTKEVDASRKARDSIGGAFEVIARNVPPGLGSHAHWDRRLDGRIGGALLSIQGIKAAEIGEGLAGSRRRGSEQHDPIDYDPQQHCFVRPSNRAGGVEGGISNGEPIQATAWLKPLATLPQPLGSIDLKTKQPFDAVRERTDTIPIVAAGVVGEAMLCWILAEELLYKFGGDSIDDLQQAVNTYRDALREY